MFIRFYHSKIEYKAFFLKKYNMNFYLLFFLTLSSCKDYLSKNKLTKSEEEEKIIELKDPNTPLPTPDEPNYFYIPIIHRNDIHGSFYPKKFYCHQEIHIL